MSGNLVFPPILQAEGGVPIVEPQSLTRYQTDFPAGGTLPSVRGKPVMVRRGPHPANPAREYTYWHMVTEGEDEDEQKRTPDLARMMRMPWAKPLLVNHSHVTVKRWWNERKGRRHYCIWHPPVNYLVVIKERYEGLFLVTTYCPIPQRVFVFHKEWAIAKKAGRTF